ncbi:DUF4164 domain-containing protein [Chelatococcus daeguensis]|nr:MULTISPECIES: DUF4164 domain-containing protein [Chelatococcus]KZE27537.1 hypothetical protein AVW15_10515 [Chelatococcus daeguensis]MBM3085768.1 DUF4164 domain-containing protein [Chelatococcus daeguensis]CUA84608.1 Domain of unknown function (DUF4164) [Chelatococcus sambhunathii]
MLNAALERLEAAVSGLERAAARRLELEQRRGDLETELSLMQDDRARLAVELDGALARLERLEAAADDVSRRVERAMGAVRTVMGAESQP